jgi:hypothetical protein
MKQYVIDELRPDDYTKLKDYLEKQFGPSTVNGIYWIPLDPDLFSDVQVEHAECQPFFFAIDLEPNLMSCELLIRTRNKIRCNCIHYATEKQRNWIIRFSDAIFEKLMIKT